MGEPVLSLSIFTVAAEIADAAKLREGAPGRPHEDQDRESALAGGSV